MQRSTLLSMTDEEVIAYVSTLDTLTNLEATLFERLLGALDAVEELTANQCSCEDPPQ